MPKHSAPTPPPSTVRYPDLDGQVIIVTGASSGIGAETARLLAQQGARVVLAARREAACEALLAEIRSVGGDGLVVRTDITLEADVERLVASTLRTFGRLDGAFNNAGVLGTGGPVETLGDAAYQHVFDVNVRAAFHCLRHQLLALRAFGKGSLVFNASMAGTVGFAQAAIYAASKHAVIGMVRSAALEVGRLGLRVNAVCPGVVDTPMSDDGFGGTANKQTFVAATPAGRWAAPKEIAQAVCFLLSGASSFVNGSALMVDGAYTAA